MGTAPVEQPRCQKCGAVYTHGERFCSIDGGAVLAPDAAADPLVGVTLDGRYLVRRRLGAGGMGVVYEAHHIGLDKPVAVKFLATDDQGDADALARFRREARVASRIVHEHVVQIYDVGTHDGHDYLVMELVEGRDLRDALAAEGRFTPERAIAIAVEMLRGLHAIHQAGIVHRDIKPANVRLTVRDGNHDFVKIMDFGISKSVIASTAVGTVTDTGKVIGTPQFMAPEQLLGAPCDHRADLYAVGLTLFAMLVGEAPFAATSLTRVAALHGTGEPPDLAALRPGLPPELVAAATRALAVSPNDRFADALAFIAALGGERPSSTGPRRPAEVSGDVTRADRPRGASNRSDAPTEATKPSEQTGARRRRIVVAALVGAGVIVAVAAAALHDRGEGRTESPPSAGQTEPAAARDAPPATAPRSAPPAPPPPPLSIPIASNTRLPTQAAPGVAPPRPPPAAAPGHGEYCTCLANTRATLCPRVSRIACTCDGLPTGASDTLSPEAMCSRAFEPCSCPAGDAACLATCDHHNPTLRCPGNAYVVVHSMHFGEDCRGYNSFDNTPASGSYGCDVCADLDRRSFRGIDGDRCSGVIGWTGSTATGVLSSCRPHPQRWSMDE